jgi:hypothetical protein
MAKDRIYAVSFQREANNKIDQITFHCWAPNAPEAKTFARNAWETRYRANHLGHKIPHMFHLEAHRAESQNIHGLRVKNWLDREITGDDVMHTFIMTHTVTRGWAWNRQY